MSAAAEAGGAGVVFSTKRLKHVVALRRLRTPAPEDGARPYIGLEDIESGTGRLVNGASATPAKSSSKPSATGGKESLGTNFERGDLLFGKLRPYLAKVWVAEFPGRCTTEALVMKPTSIDPRFLRSVCLSPRFVGDVDASTFGAKMPRAEWDFIGNMSVPVPDPETQTAIADYLDRETARLDALMGAKQRLLKLLAEKRRAIIARAVTCGLDPRAPMRDSGVPWLGEIPAHWKSCHLKRVLSTVDYGVSVQVDTSGEIAVLRMGDIQDGEIDYSNVGFVEEVDDALLLRPGDLVFNRTNSLDRIGKVALFRGASAYPVSFASYLVRLRCNGTALPEFLVWLLNSVPVLAWARAEAMPAIGQANLNPHRYGYLPVAIPPPTEQRAIVGFLEAECEKLNTLSAESVRTIGLLKERRSTLIAAAVTGSLVVGKGSHQPPSMVAVPKPADSPMAEGRTP